MAKNKINKPLGRIEIDDHPIDPALFQIDQPGDGTTVFGVCRSGKVNAAKAYMAALRKHTQVSDNEEEDDG